MQVGCRADTTSHDTDGAQVTKPGLCELTFRDGRRSMMLTGLLSGGEKAKGNYGGGGQAMGAQRNRRSRSLSSEMRDRETEQTKLAIE